MAQDVKSIISSIQELNKKSAKGIYIPSLNREVSFNPLTAKDQKLLLESNIDNVIYQSKFYIETYELIKRLSHEDIVSQLTTIDRDYILISLRSKFLGSDITIKDKEFDLTDIVNQEISVDYNEDKVIWEDIILNCKECSLNKEYAVYKHIYNQKNNINPKDTEELREIVGNLYIYEIYKYVDSIFIDQGGSEINIDFNSDDFSINQKIEILLSLDRTLIQGVMKFIGKFKDINSLKIGDTIIPIDSELFSV